MAASLLALAPLQLPNRRPTRSFGNQEIVVIFTECSTGCSGCSTNTSGDDAGKWRQVALWAQHPAMDALIDQVQELGRRFQRPRVERGVGQGHPGRAWRGLERPARPPCPLCGEYRLGGPREDSLFQPLITCSGRTSFLVGFAHKSIRRAVRGRISTMPRRGAMAFKAVGWCEKVEKEGSPGGRPTLPASKHRPTSLKTLAPPTIACLIGFLL